IAQNAQRPSHAASHNLQRGMCRESKSTGKVRTQARSPCGKVKLLAVARRAHKTNVHPVGRPSVPMRMRPATRKSAVKKEGNPDAKIQSSYWASEKIVTTASQKQTAIAPAPIRRRRGRRQMPAGESEQ